MRANQVIIVFQIFVYDEEVKPMFTLFTVVIE